MIDPKEQVLRAFMAMTKGEQRELLVELMGRMGVVAEPADVEVPEATGGRPRKGRSLYWLKRVTGWDDEAKKGFRLLGDFVRPSACKEGEVLAMGMTAREGKRYAKVMVDRDCMVTFEGPEGVGTVSVEGVRVVFETGDWEDFERVMRGSVT